MAVRASTHPAAGRWALVTGASEGLGREFARLAAADGYDLILSARRGDLLEALAVDLRALGREVVVVTADLAVEGAAERLWRAASVGRDIGVLVNNAGLGANGAFSDRAEWGREYASLMVNVVSATVLMKEAVTAMVAGQGGRVLNVASTAGFMPGPWMAVYHATKAHMLSLSEAVAQELQGSGVSVTALCPGVTRTGFFAAGGMEGSTLIQRLPMPSAAEVAVAGWAAMQRGKRVAVPGVQNKLFAFLPRLVPRMVVTWMAGIFLQRR